MTPATRFCLTLLAGIAALLTAAGLGPTAASSRRIAAAEPAATGRVPWTASAVVGSPEPPPPLRPRRLFPHLRFANPTVLTTAPGTDRFFVAEMRGNIYSIPADPDCRHADLLLDARTLVDALNEDLAPGHADRVAFGAIYGLAFHPDFERNRFAYLCYVVNYEDGKRGAHPQGTRVVRLTVTSKNDVPTCDPASEVEIITWLAGGHNGGCLKFGPEGCLYISAGDGGNPFPPDPLKTGQDVSDLLSSILRIDVDHRDGERAYRIPADNPLLAFPGARGEIFAYGLRNPWKMSFDRRTGELWAGDVGWEMWELVCRVRAGDNFGWSIVEGRQSVNADWPRGPTAIVPPTVDVSHADGASITGGFVYRGGRFPELVGTYIFGDWETRRVWGVSADAPEPGPIRDIALPTIRIIDFAEDRAGELYLLDYDDGTIHELVRNEVDAATRPFPTRLSETGMFADTAAQRPMPGVVPFEIAAETWADHATAQRFIGLTGTNHVELYAQPKEVPGSMFRRSLFFPAGTVLAKTFSLEMVAGRPETARRIETQLLHFDGSTWRGYTYAWNDRQTDAELVEAGGRRQTLSIHDAAAPGGVREQVWRFSSRNECLRCHNPWAENALAFTVGQLNRDVPGEQGPCNQLRAFRDSGLIRDQVIEPNLDADPFAKVERPGPESSLPRLADPADSSAPIDGRARAYLHVNCSHCHRFGGGGSASLFLNRELSLRDIRAVGTPPAQGSFGIPESAIITAGDPFRSTLFYRMATAGPGRMPHIGSEIVDERGLHLIHDWIEQLPANFTDADLVERLIGLDEPASLAREADERPRKRWQMARQHAVEAGRTAAAADDFAFAEEALAAQAKESAAARGTERSKLIAELLGSTSRAILLAQAIRQGRLPDSTRGTVIEASRQHQEPVIVALFEGFVPPDQRVRRLGTAVDPAEILALEGDADRGFRLFHEAAGMQCRNCHMVKDVGREIGPPLTEIGRKLDRARLLESLLQPSKTIDPKYQTWLVETTAGRVASGLLVARTDQGVTLRDAENRTVEIAAGDIEQMLPQTVSLMPEHLLRDLSATQAADLLAYLESLR